MEVEAKLVENLSSFLKKTKGQALFACGGSILIIDETIPRLENAAIADSTELAENSEAIFSRPVTVRWDARDGKTPSGNTKISFPLNNATERNLDHLLNVVEPATFGRGGEDVYDEAYRKAVKLDTDKFSSTFNPYELGIIDTVAQLLLPSAIDSRIHRAVRAELYKLNVYSGPSGKFKRHVDTPRSSDQFGSLVVCLPVQHEGGQLKIWHAGKDFAFDWSTHATDADHASIRWAAFYSDCEHEVLEVTNGHRVTLTNNLFAVRGRGSLAGNCPALDTTYLPLYHAADAVLKDNRFMEHGDLLPVTLKELDMVVWETFGSLGIEARLRPVIKFDDSTFEGLFDEWKSNEPKSQKGSNRWVAWRKTKPQQGFVGPKLKFEVDWDMSQIEQPSNEHAMYADWQGDVKYKDVTWLNTPTHEELQLLYIAYGNEASMGCQYSHCAIVGNIPPFKDGGEHGRQSMAVAAPHGDGSSDGDGNSDGDGSDGSDESSAICGGDLVIVLRQHPERGFGRMTDHLRG